MSTIALWEGDFKMLLPKSVQRWEGLIVHDKSNFKVGTNFCPLWFQQWADDDEKCTQSQEPWSTVHGSYVDYQPSGVDTYSQPSLLSLCPQKITISYTMNRDAFNSSFLSSDLFISVCVCACECIWAYMYRSKRTTYESRFSPSTTWLLGIQFTSSGLVTALYQWITSPVLF